MPEGFIILFWCLTLWPLLIYPALIRLLGLFFACRSADETAGFCKSDRMLLRISLAGKTDRIQQWKTLLNELPSLHLQLGLDGFLADEELEELGAHPRCELIQFSQKRGKSRVLNDLQSRAPEGFDWLFLADGDTRFGVAELMALGAGFRLRDGVVAAEVEYTCGPDFEIRYILAENHLRRAESQLGIYTGLSGGLMLLRQRGYPSLSPAFPSDLEIPLKMVQSGWQARPLPGVKVYESLAHRDPVLRRVRTLIRGVACVHFMLPRLALHGRIRSVVGLLFRKWMRWMSPLFLAVSFPLALRTSQPEVFLFGSSSILFGLIGWARGIHLLTAWLKACAELLRGRRYEAW